MILLFGALRDSGIAHLVHRLADRQIPFHVLDPHEMGRGYQLSWQWADGVFRAQLTIGNTVRPLDDVRGVYVHHISSAPPDNLEQTGSSATEMSWWDARWMIASFLETAPFRVCNRPSAGATNHSKPYQQLLIAAHGLATPRTLITNIPEEARAFYMSCRKRVIYKSVSARRSIVKRMTDDDLQRLEMLRAGPVQFQEWLAGVDVRVHVMGSRVYATEITSDATDYRYSYREAKPRSMRGVQLPDTISEACVRLTESLGLLSSGIDLRKTPDGRYCCFEANTSPGFAFFEQYTGQRIADGLIDTLLE